MAGVRLAALVRTLRRGGALDSGGSSDADLLARFASARDEAAFELLVWRHGGMVLAACRRVLGHTEDAEDAFQAAFLVLARKATSIRGGTAIPAWLHRVAVRVARRASAAHRSFVALGAELAARPDPDAAEQIELRGLLDEAIDRLSEPLRRAFVLCYLEGLSNADAARELGCPVGTVESRLTAARRALRDRLARQVTLPAGVLAVLGCQPVLAAEAVGTAKRAGAVAAVSGLRAAIGIVREPAVRLAEGVLTMTKAQMWFAGVLGASLLGLAAGVGWANSAGEPPTQPPAAPEVGAAQPTSTPPVAPPLKPAEPAPKGAWPLATQLALNGSSNLIGVTPDGKSLLMLQERSVHGVLIAGSAGGFVVRSENAVSGGAVSPDGKLVATAEGANGVKLRDPVTGRVVEALWPEGDLPAAQVAFTSDGTKLVVLCARADSAARDKGRGGFGAPPDTKVTQVTRVSVWDVATRKEIGHPAQTDAGEHTAVPQYTLAGQGRFALRTQGVLEAAGPPNTIKARRYTVTDAVTGAAGKPIEVAGASLGPVRPDPLSPDGKTLVLMDYTQNLLRFVDAGTGQDRFRVPAFRRPVKAVTFSADGKLVAAATGASGSGRTDTIAAPSEVVIWDAATGKELARLTDKENIRDYTALAFSPDGSFLAAQNRAGGNVTVTTWGRLPAAEAVNPAPAKSAPKGSDAPDRFPALFRDLSDAGVTDARRVEALFLAALGRFPTDVEARTLAAQLASRTDKAAALRDLLGPLTETAEFRAHAEGLGRLVK